ncbi:MAG: hypothetical protein AB1414_03770 [bacterium]
MRNWCQVSFFHFSYLSRTRFSKFKKIRPDTNYFPIISFLSSYLFIFPVVWGGVHPRLLPEQIVQSEMVDIACVGEGEISFSELIKALEERKEWSNVPGICYRKNGKIVSTNSPPLYRNFPLKIT